MQTREVSSWYGLRTEVYTLGPGALSTALAGRRVAGAVN